MSSASDSTATRQGAPRSLGPIAAWLCIVAGVIETLQGYGGALMREDSRALRQALLFSGLPWIPAALLAPLVVRLAARRRLDGGLWRASLAWHIAGTLAFVIVHETAVSLLLPALGAFPLGMVIFIKQFSARSALDIVVYWAMVGAAHAVWAAREASERAQATARLQTSLVDARLIALRAQLDPHFLFNTLNAIGALALQGDAERVAHALSTLSDLLRDTLGGAPTQEVALRDEFALLDRYLEIQLLRFSDRLDVVHEVDEDVLEAAVPAMLLQPIVENAMQHAVAVRTGRIRIALRARRIGGILRLEVQDSGPGFASELREGIGLGNTRARLEQLYGHEQRLELENNDEGAVVSIALPFRRVRSMEEVSA